MNSIQYKDPDPRQSPKRSKNRIPRLLVCLPLLILVVLVIERMRGQAALKAWAREMTAHGEILDAKQLWPTLSISAVALTNALDMATKGLPPSLLSYSGQILCIVPGPSGRWHRGSQEPRPVFWNHVAGTNTWNDVDAAVKEAQADLAALRQLMKTPPAGISYDFNAVLENVSVPNLVCVRIGAQALQTAAVRDLHHNDLAGAFENLTALEGFVRFEEDDPGLVSLMVRVAVVGITVEVLWDALHAEGWSEQQLATLQELCRRNQKLLMQLPRATETERFMHLHNLEWFRSHSYNESIDRDGPLLESFGVQRADIDRAAAPRLWRQWVFHPLWSFAWADREKFQYLKDRQQDVLAVREAAVHGSCRRLETELKANRTSYRAPFGDWRFYHKVPLREEVSYTRAWSTTLKRLTLNELALTAIAIKRYELRHGHVPGTLAELSPDILNDAPRDFMDGDTLRYRARPDGTFSLYSIGMDFRDDAGDDAAAASRDGQNRLSSPWDGKDWVWL